MLTTTELRLLSPEIVLASGALVVLILGLFRNVGLRILTLTTAAFITADIAALVWFVPAFGNEGGIMLTGGVYMSLNIGRLILGIAALCSLALVDERTISRHRSEFLIMLLALLTGGQLLIVSNHAAMVLLAVEMMSLSSYVLAGFLFRREGVSATVTYFIYGSLATATLCFGYALMFSAGGSLETDVMSDMLHSGNIPSPIWLTGFIFITTAVLFKMSAAPQHLWVPDVYTGAPLPVLSLFSTIPKIAAVFLLARILLKGSDQAIDWMAMVSAIAGITLLAGNFPALSQPNIRKLMGYSSIAQAGFLLLALLAPEPMGPVLFYSLILTIGNVLVFAALARLEHHGAITEASDLDGLGKSDPWGAAGLTIGVLSLTGLPPLAGFTAKLTLFTGLWRAVESTGSRLMLGIFAFGLINTVIALFYYLRMPFHLFLRPGKSERPTSDRHPPHGWMIAVLSAALLWFFIRPPF